MTPPALAPLTVAAVELVRVAMPLVTPFRTSFGVQHTRDVLLVCVHTPSGDGWGECSAPDAPVYSSEYTDGAAHVLEHHLLPRLFAAGAVAPAQLGAVLAPVRGHRMAKAALEAAMLDAALRDTGTSLAEHLGGVRDRVACGVSIGIPDAGADELVDDVARYLDRGYVRIKVKIAPGFDVAAVGAVRDAFGPQLRLQVDANAGYTLADAAVFERLDDLDLELIEQPLGEERVVDHARLAERLTTPLCLDESIHDAAAAVDAIDLGACQIVNVKAGRVGGLLEAVRIHDACRDRGVPVWCGGMLETGIGRAANLALAALPGFTLPGDTSASDRYWATDLTEPFVLDDGHLPVPRGPGIGVSPDPAILAAAATSRRMFRRTAR